MITCREFIEFLWRYVADDLPADQKFEFDAHIAVCPACVAYMRSYEATRKLEKAALEMPDARVPDDVPEDLVRAILAAKGK